MTNEEIIDRKLFDNKRDNALIATSHFYCKAHLRAIPIADRSPRNPDYCRECYAIVHGEKPEKNPDRWSGQTLIHFGKKYVVATSPMVSSQGDNFLRELRNYRFDDDKQAAPSEKLARIVTEPLKPLAIARTIAAAGDNIKTNDKKCLFCGKLITWGNKKTRYCSDGCRTAEYRRRNAAV